MIKILLKAKVYPTEIVLLILDLKYKRFSSLYRFEYNFNYIVEHECEIGFIFGSKGPHMPKAQIHLFQRSYLSLYCLDRLEIFRKNLWIFLNRKYNDCLRVQKFCRQRF